MRSNNNRFYNNYQNNNSSSVRTTINPNTIYKSPSTYIRSPNANLKCTPPNFNQSIQSLSFQVSPKYASNKTQQTLEENQKNRTNLPTSQKNVEIRKFMEKQAFTGKQPFHETDKRRNKNIKVKFPFSPQPDIRTTLDVVNFPPRKQLNSSSKQTGFSPKPYMQSVNGFWRSPNKVENGKRSNESLELKPFHSDKKLQLIKSKGIHQFKLLKLIGQNSYSDVYLSIDKKTLTLWGIKRLKKSLIHSNQLKDYFAHIISNHFRLNHPNVIKIYDIFSDDSYVYLVEEFIQSGTLEQYISKAKNSGKQIEFGQKICEIGSGLKYIHSKSVIHSGLKPSSILLSHDTCKISLIKSLNIRPLVIRRNLKEMLYIPPQTIESKVISEANDIWAMGLIFYELCMLKPLFFGTNEKIIEHRVINFTLDQIKLPEEISFQVEGLLRSLLQPNPKHRMSAQETMEHNYMVQHRTDNEWDSATKTEKTSSISNKSSESSNSKYF